MSHSEDGEPVRKKAAGRKAASGAAKSGGSSSTRRKSGSTTAAKKTKKKTTRKKAKSQTRSTGKSATGKSAAGEPSRSRRVNQLEVHLDSLDGADLKDAWRFWSGASQGSAPDPARARKDILEWMGDAQRVMARLDELGRRLGGIFDAVLASPRYELTLDELTASKELEYLSSYELETSLGTLRRRAILLDTESKRVSSAGDRAVGVPRELGDLVLQERRSAQRGVFDVFTLRGHLDRIYDDPERARRMPPSRVREFYKMYSNESASVARVERLPEGLRDLVEKVLLEFGGLLPRTLFDRMDTDLPHWNARRWAKILEESIVGTVERLELGKYGIHHNDETLIVFNEVTLAWLKQVAVPGDPDKPADEASIGVDLVSNITRFLAFIIDHQVRFTVRGEIFKTTEKRILSDLIPNPGRELERAEVLEFIYRFARREQLIESTGERTFALSTAGREWEERGFEEKLAALFQYVLEEVPGGTEAYHQIRMRQMLVRMMKRIEPGVWYDIMYLPFLARNSYLARLDELAVDDYFAARSSSTGGGSEDLQRMAWGLVHWLRKRLYLLGIIDLGYDAGGHPVALRLTRTGARLLGMVEPESEAPRVGNLVVTPDFEVVLFPTGDDAALIHDLDRFCERAHQGDVRHFRVAESSVKRALVEGMSLQRVIETLELNARTPVPQNVLISLRDWADQAGLLRLSKEMVIRGQDPDHMRRFVQDPGVKGFVKKVLDDRSVQLKAGRTATRMRSLLRELGFLIELE